MKTNVIRFSGLSGVITLWRVILTNTTGREITRPVGGPQASFDVDLSAADSLALLPAWVIWAGVVRAEVIHN